MIFDQPLAVGPLVLKNRLVMVPVATGKADARGQVTQALCDHYAMRARGGHLGLVECGHHFVCEEGRATARQASIAHDEDIEGLKREAAAVHSQGTPVFVQLSHAGSAATEALTGAQPLAPSAVTCPGAKVGHPLPRAMSADDISRVPQLFSAASRRAHAAGFDGVEIHAAHGYLLDQFLSPLTNLREDAYGGPLENRARLLLEVLGAVRAELPPDYPVSVRLGGCDYLPGGNTVADAVALARMAEAAGASLISVSGGMCYYGRPGHEDTPGWFADSSAPIRAAVGIPVLLAGGIKTGSAAEALLEQGACDLAGIGRAILNRPAWARRETTKLRAASKPVADTKKIATTPAQAAEEDSMDESDRKLAERLREQLEANGAKTAFDAPAEAQSDAPQGEQDDAGSLVEGPFAQAMNAYRQAKRSGDAEATAAAERHLQEVVRAELAGSAEPCSGDER